MPTDTLETKLVWIGVPGARHLCHVLRRDCGQPNARLLRWWRRLL